MSQLADIEEVVCNCPLPRSDQKARLFYEILQALDWEVDGVENVSDAHAYLMMRGHLPFESIK